MNELNVLVKSQAGAPLPAIVWNEDEVKANLDELLAAYEGRVYTEADIKGAKADRAAVNQLDAQLGEALTAVRRRYMEPVDAFAEKIKTYRAQVKEVSGAIDKQVKAVEAARKAEKQAALQQKYSEFAGGELAALIPFERFMQARWLNASVSMTTATQELLMVIEACRAELDMLRKTCGEDFAAVERVYLKNLSIREALAEYDRLKDAREAQTRAEAAREAEKAARAAAPVIVPPTPEQTAAQAAGAARAAANAHITEDGRLDFSGLQAFAEPERRRYRFWVEFTAADIAWFKAAAKERGFLFGAIQQ